MDGNMPQLLLLNGKTFEKDSTIIGMYLKRGLDVRAYEELDTSKELIVLNTQIILTPDWIDRLNSVLHSFINIGTVSPLSKTELTVQGIDLKRIESLPEEYVATILLACECTEFPEVTQNDFNCILIRQELLQNVGIPEKEVLYNSQKAKKWFEECRQLGWIHNVCTTVLMSCSDALECCNDVFTQYGKYLLDKFTENLCLFFTLQLDNGRKCILHYLLADFQEGMSNNVGGTQFHVADLVEYQRYSYNVFVLARDGEYLRLSEYVNDNKVRFDFWVGKISDNITFYDKRYYEICGLILKCFSIDLVHIHHTLWMTLDIFSVAQEREIPIVLSIHDFYFACPILKMINPEGKMCDRQSCSQDCEKCLSENKGILNGSRYLEKYRKEYKKVIEASQIIIHPSADTIEIMSQFYPEIRKKAVEIGHGIVLPKRRKEHDYGHAKKRIAFIGGISDIKGGPLIYDLVKNNCMQYEWYIMGGISYRPLYHLEQSNLHKTGWYKRYEIYDLLLDNEIDIVCILSTVAETFCYTLSEALAVGIPVLATDVGALGSRMKGKTSGWLVPRDVKWTDIEQLLSSITSSNIYKEKMKNAILSEVKSLPQMGKEYDDIYMRYMKKDGKKQEGNYGEILPFRHLEPENYIIEENKIRYAENGTIYEDNIKKEVASLRNRLNELENSPIVRCALKLRKIPFPGKEILKILYKKIRK